MTLEIAICLTILLAAFVLFAWERIPADVVALGIMLTLIATRVLTPEQGVAGFASDTVLTILGLLILTASLSHTGVVDHVGRLMLRAFSKGSLLLAIMITSASVGAFISNTASTAFFIPVVMELAKRTKTSPSRYLLPLAFSSILTSSVTLISTSTNLVVSQVMTQYRMPSMGMFELAPVGIPIAIVGILYMWLVGQHLMPVKDDSTGEVEIGQRKYLADIIVLADSPLIGKTIGSTRLGPHSALRIVKLIRDGQPRKTVRKSTKLKERDRLVIEGPGAEIIKVKEIPGVELTADVFPAPYEKEKEDLAIVEGVLLPQSRLIGRMLNSAEFKERYGLQVLGINRAGTTIRQEMSTMRLRLGDVLLLQGTRRKVAKLEGTLFNIFGGVDPGRLNIRMAPVAAGIFALVLIIAWLEIVPVPVAMLGGAFLVLITRCIPPEEAYRQVEWKAIVLIASLISLGLAMEQTGTGRYLAVQLLGLVGNQAPTVLLAVFFLLTIALTQPMSNQAAAIVILPVAIQTALQLGYDPRTFAIMVAVAASCSYLTPLEPACLMVYGPGKYRFADFFKVGLPLTVLIFAVALVLVPIMWPPVR